jgi:hypothetical protein
MKMPISRTFSGSVNEVARRLCAPAGDFFVPAKPFNEAGFQNLVGRSFSEYSSGT